MCTKAFLTSGTPGKQSEIKVCKILANTCVVLSAVCAVLPVLSHIGSASFVKECCL